MTQTNNLAPSLSIAGVWQPVSQQYITATNAGVLADTFYGGIDLGATGQEGLVLTGWVYSDPAGSTITPVNIAALAQNADGTMSLVTNEYFPNATTNGGGSVVIASFNGEPGIFLAAHNESPLLASSSTAFIQTSPGIFDKISLPDSVMAHDGTLAYIDGAPTVLTATFQPGDAFPEYTWSGTGFTEDQAARDSNGNPIINGLSIAVADFFGNNQVEAVFGDSTYGPGYSWSATNPGILVMYNLVGGQPSGIPTFLPTPYFNNNPTFSQYVSGLSSSLPTHTFRIVIDDFNHDGLPDIIAEQSIWSASIPAQVSQLQMLQNNGNGTFSDVTNNLNMSYNIFSEEADYSLQVVDIDHSGINSYLSGHGTNGENLSASYQNNFVIVNDGAGDLYYAMHDEFAQLSASINQYLGPTYSASPYYLNSPSTVYNFYGYLDSNGLLEFEAQVPITEEIGGVWTQQYVFVNVPADIDIDTYFTTPITVNNRNGSHLIRTFAGNDVIYSGNDGGYSHIDGGDGTNEIIYSGPRSNYTLSQQATGAWVVGDNVGTDGTDTIVNIQELRFTDSTVTLNSTPLHPVTTDYTPWLANQTPDQHWQIGVQSSWTLPAYTFVDTAPPEESDSGQSPTMMSYAATLANGQALPSWLFFDQQTDALSGTAPSGSGPLFITVTATDVTTGQTADDTFCLVAYSSSSPVVRSHTPDQTVVAGRSFSYALPSGTFADPQGQELTLTATLPDGSALPSWLTFNPATDIFSGAVASGSGSLTVRLTATDTSGLSATESFAFIDDVMTVSNGLTPSVSLISTGGATSQAIQMISGTAAYSALGAMVTVYDGAVSLGSAKVQTDGDWSLGATLSSGPQTVTATQAGTNGQTASSVGVSYTLSSSAPAEGILSSLTPDQEISAIYVGYFNRAPDTAGYQFWEGQYAAALADGQSQNQTLQNIANAFTPQTETLSLYPFLSTQTLDPNSATDVAGVENIVADIYTNLFDRTPLVSNIGVQYWVHQILSGAVPLGVAILDIANGAQGSDADVVFNKVTVGDYFAAQAAAASPASQLSKSLSHAVLMGVTADPTTVATAENAIDGFVSGMANVRVGTVGNDVLAGGNVGGDIIYPGGGEDRINLSPSHTTETIYFGATVSVSASSIVAVTNSTGVTEQGFWGNADGASGLSASTSLAMSVVNNFTSGPNGDVVAFAFPAWGSGGVINGSGTELGLVQGDATTGVATGAVTFGSVSKAGGIVAATANLILDSVGTYANGAALASALSTSAGHVLLAGAGLAVNSDAHILVAYSTGTSVNIADVELDNRTNAAHNDSAQLSITASDMVELTGISISALTAHNIAFVS